MHIICIFQADFKHISCIFDQYSLYICIFSAYLLHTNAYLTHIIAHYLHICAYLSHILCIYFAYFTNLYIWIFFTYLLHITAYLLHIYCIYKHISGMFRAYFLHIWPTQPIYAYFCAYFLHITAYSAGLSQSCTLDSSENTTPWASQDIPGYPWSLYRFCRLG